MENSSLLQRTQAVPPHITAYSHFETPRALSSSSFSDFLNRIDDSIPPDPPPQPQPEPPPIPDADVAFKDLPKGKKRSAVRCSELRAAFQMRYPRLVGRTEIDAAIYAAIGIEPDKIGHSPAQLGKMIVWTVAEDERFATEPLGRRSIKYKLRGKETTRRANRFPASFIPASESPEETKRRRDLFNLPHKAECARRLRAANAIEEAAKARDLADIDCRESAAHRALDNKWKTALQVSELLKRSRSPAFQPLTGPSMKRAVQRVLVKLVTAGRAKMKRDLLKKTRRPVGRFRQV